MIASCMFTGMFRRETFETAVKNAAKIGYDAVEIRYAPDHFPEGISNDDLVRRRKLIEGLGLRVAELYGFAGKFSTSSDEECLSQLEEICRELDVARILGTNMLKIECGGPNAFMAQSYHFDKCAFWIRKAARIADLNGMRLSLEIHNGSLVEDVTSALRLWRMIDMENVGFIHDAGNMYITGDDFGALSVKRLGNHLFHVHVKDVLRVDDSSRRDSFRNLTKNGSELFALTPLGEGGADHAELFQALREAGYDGCASTEANLSMDAMEMTLHEYAELKRLIARGDGK